MAPLPPARVTAAMCAYGRTVAEPRLSPDGRTVAFVATVSGRGQLVTMAAAGGPEWVVTSDPPPKPARAYGGGVFDWTPDGHRLVYAATDGGLWLAPVSGGRPRQLVQRPAAGPAAAPAVSPDGTRVAFVVDQHHVAVAPLDDDDGGPAWPARLSGSADFCFDPCWSPAGDMVAWHEWDVPWMPWDESRIALRWADGSEKIEIVAGGPGRSVQQPRFSPDGSMLGYLDDGGGWLNVWGVPAGGGETRPLLAEECEHGDPSWGLGQRSFAWSPDGRRLVVCRNEAGFGSLHLLAPERQLRPLGRGVHGSLSWRDERLVALRSGARTPTQVVVYHGPDLADRATLAVGPVGGFDQLDLAEPEAVTWPGDDGVSVHGRLYRPEAPVTGGDEPPPLLCWIHGGPTGQWQVSFMARIAYWVDRGWAVLLPDHRGSTGFGRAYTQALAGRWGELDVADVAAGMRAAAERGWADPRRMVVMGGSAGGFTVLNLLAHHPELCAAGVDLFGVTDLFDLDETTHRFEAHYLHTLVGPLPAAAARYRERSPLDVAERIQAPLLILQGADDEAVPPAQSKAIAERLRALGRTVELHLYDGEGHGWSRPETIVDELGRIESFLRRHVLRWRD